MAFLDLFIIMELNPKYTVSSESGNILKNTGEFGIYTTAKEVMIDRGTFVSSFLLI
jgi:hypothetical protein